MQMLLRGVIVVGVSMMGWATAEAQTAVTLPDATQATTFTAAVSDQATVTVPAGVTFAVTNVSASTAASKATIAISYIVLASATAQFRVSVKANAASFTPPVGGATTWSASDVSWSTPNSGPDSWVNGTRTNGTLSDTAFNAVGTCNADASSCSTTGFTLSLAAKSSVKRSGNHTLIVTWKFESL